MIIAQTILTACAVALGAWGIWSLVRPPRGLKPHERAWAKMLGVPEANTRAELADVLRPKLHAGMDASTEGDRMVHALARISPEGAREHVHVFEDADWSAGVVPTPPTHAFFGAVGVDSAAVVARRARAPLVVVPPPPDPYPPDEVTEVVRITDPVNR